MGYSLGSLKYLQEETIVYLDGYQLGESAENHVYLGSFLSDMECLFTASAL